MLRLTSGEIVRVVRNIDICAECLGCSIVNGRDDLFDLGFTVEGLDRRGLTIDTAPQGADGL